MKFKVLSSLVAVGALLLAGVGCGDDGTTGGSGGTGGGNDGGSGGDDGTGGTPVVTGGGGEGGGTGGGSGDGNDTLETADEMEVDSASGVSFVEADLDPPDTDVDYFSFEGTAGPWEIGIDAVPDEETDPMGFVDTVITLFDAQGNQLASNDDPFPRFSTDSDLYTVLPADGTYYVRVEEWCASSTADPTFCNDDYFAAISDTYFLLFAGAVDPADDGITPEGTEPNDTELNAPAWEYVDNGQGGYFLGLGVGEWASSPDTDGFYLSVPVVTPDAGTRAQGWFVFPPQGEDGNGGATRLGVVTVTGVTGPDAGLVVAEFDYSNEAETAFEREELTFPLVPGEDYLVTLSDGPPADGGSAPFYFNWHTVLTGGNPVEVEPNDTTLLAEPLTLPAGDPDSYFVEGNLPVGDLGDVFELTTLAVPTLTVACGGASSGSGVTLNVRVLAEDGTELDSMTETPPPAGTLLIEDVDTTGETTVFIEVTADSQDPNIDGTWYKCGFHFVAPAQ